MYVDGLETASFSLAATNLCDGKPCLVTFVSVGAEARLPFPLPIHRLRLFPGLVSPNTTRTLTSDAVAPLPYHGENSRWVEISRGANGVDITWHTFGWEQGAHQQVTVSLDPSGRTTVVTANVSSLWDRAIASAGGASNDHQGDASSNWSSSALNTTGATAVQITYIDSDPCFGASLFS